MWIVAADLICSLVFDDGSIPQGVPVDAAPAAPAADWQVNK